MRDEEEEKLSIKRSAAYVNLSAIDHNLDLLGKNLEVKQGIFAVIKANGYGHGAVMLARHLARRKDIAGFAVACAEEAMELRRAGIIEPILILGFVFPDDYEVLINHDVRIAAFREDTLEDLEKAAKMVGKKALVHVAVDTGMGRIGVMPDETGVNIVKQALNKQNITVEGVFSHFARADEKNKDIAIAQYDCFNGFLKRINEELDFTFPIVHLANSAAMMEFKQAAFDLARAGISMYGLYPSNDLMPEAEELEKEAKAGYPNTLKPALSWVSSISHIKTLPADYPISYGGTYVTTKKTRVATIPVGYADGYPRSLSGKGYVLIKGKRAPILGRECMDQFMVNVSHIPDAKVEDKVTLLGADGEERITAEFLGDLSGRFNYELVCLIGRRVPRIYTSP